MVVYISDMNPRRLFARKRRENAPDGAREKYYRVYVTAEEDAQLQARAAVAGDITVPRLLFESAMNAQVRTGAEWKGAVAELMQVRADLGRMSSNLNQLAKFANTEGQFPAQVEEFRVLFVGLVPQISAACRAVAGQ
ncbi:plasmid mobilization protein [Subtercola boreus]|uniref:plasmid mobilization protein n=1 Tax=Subtercola boreus TaxID=120213 RepID=UPI0011C02463|nr:plasmid mobilization relaxosome protein MobC [Subtercola boreus]